MSFVLPDLILLQDHGGNFYSYDLAVYQVFQRDFVITKPEFRGTRLGLKAYPLIEGKEYTYYHFTHDGNVENDRIPNIRRMERIGFPRPMIDNSLDGSLKVWRNKRGSKDRILIFNEDHNYLVVLEDRGRYILPWTAYFVDKAHNKRKLLNEYQEYINAEAAR